MTLLNFSTLGTQITDEPIIINTAGAQTFAHDYYLSSGLVIRTAPGGAGTLLSLNTDYTIQGYDSFYQAYKTVTFLSRNGEKVYCTYKAKGDTVDADDVNSRKPFHGIETVGVLSFAADTHIFSIAAATNTYWYKGTKVTTTAAITCHITDYISLAANELYYIYFDDATGVLKAAESVWDLKAQVPVATVWWNGTAGAIQRETHNHTRDLDWHINNHLTIGSRYYNGLDLTKPTTTYDANIDITTGNIYDEDLLFAITNPTTCRIVYAVSSGVYTFVDSSYPYLTANPPIPQRVHADYTLIPVDSAKYVCSWVYATGDIARPIYIVPTHASGDHNTMSAARNEKIPVLSGFNLTPEMKLIYRFIYKGDGQFQEAADYRTVSSLPAGAVASTSAAAVTFAPHSTISATNVQGAIEELTDEKSETGHTHADVTESVAGFMAAADKTKLNGIATSANNYTHPAHTGDVTGSAALTIGPNKVTLAMHATQAANTVIANNTTGAAIPAEITMAASTLLGRAASGNIAALSVSDVTAMLNTTAAAATGDWGWI